MTQVAGDDATTAGATSTVVALLSGVILGAGGLILGFTMTYLAAGILILGFGIELTPASLIVLGLVFTQGIGCGGVALAYTRWRPQIARSLGKRFGSLGGRDTFDLGIKLPTGRDLGIVVVGYLLAFGGALLGALVVSQFQVDTGANQAAEIGMENPEVLLLLIPASILIIGPGEELLFRGVVQGRLREVMGPVGAIGIASVIFAGLHWFALSGGSPTGNLVALGILVIPSLVFGISYEYTGNVVVPSLIHGIYNATLFSLLYISVVFAGEFDEGEMAVLSLLGM